jgi:hypothetical protein
MRKKLRNKLSAGKGKKNYPCNRKRQDFHASFCRRFSFKQVVGANSFALLSLYTRVVYFWRM